jgi:Protein of unknown function (DUF4232)
MTDPADPTIRGRTRRTLRRRLGAACATGALLGAGLIVGTVGTASAALASSSATSAAAGHCDAYQLTASYKEYTGYAQGDYAIRFSVKNTSARPCTLYGYFGISAYARDGGKLLTANDKRSTRTLGGRLVKDHLITLNPNGEVSTAIQTGDGPTKSGESCPTIRGFHLIPPNDTNYKRALLPHSLTVGICHTGSPLTVYPTTQG